jgi:hypothetical protein
MTQGSRLHFQHPAPFQECPFGLWLNGDVLQMVKIEEEATRMTSECVPACRETKLAPWQLVLLP